MPKTLVLVRHGRPEPGGFKPDFERELTPEGRTLIAASYPQVFAALDPATTEIWSSPALRAWQTAEVVAEALDMGEDDIIAHDELYAQDAEAFLDALAASDADTVVAVAHIPLVERLLYGLTGVGYGFDAGAAAAISIDGDSAELAWFEQGPSCA